MSHPRILIAEPRDFSNDAADQLRLHGEVILGMPRDLADAFQEFDIVWVRLARRITADIIGDNPRCRILATPVTGLDHIDLDACRESGIHVVSLKGEIEFLRNVRATAELTVGLLLSLLRKIPEAVSATRQGNWDRDQFRGNELFGKTAGIVGVGRLGTLVAGYLHALGMEVIGYDPRPGYPENVAERVGTLDELFKRSDVLTIHAVYDASTRHLIGEPQFAMARSGSVLINTARGGIVDERALLNALESGRIAGAALDVLDGEPAINKSHPLIEYSRTHNNLLIVPHIGGSTWESFEKTELFLAARVVDAMEQVGFDVHKFITEPRVA